jgi:hypothetical protein
MANSAVANRGSLRMLLAVVGGSDFCVTASHHAPNRPIDQLIQPRAK